MRCFTRLGRLALALALLALATLGAQAADEKKKDEKKTEPDVIFVPTPEPVVDKMLEMAKVTGKDTLYDLGCGDGRIVIRAARKGAKAVGIDIQEDMIKECKSALAKEKEEVKKRVTFEQKDFFKADLSKATVVALYLVPDVNKELVPQLNKMKPGSRIVSHGFDIPGFKPDQTIVFKTKDDKEYDIYLYTIPLKPIQK